jgi:uncharacterized protein
MWLRIVRVYTKIPGGKANKDHPFIFREGALVFDLARSIHKDMAEKFKYARIWGSDKYDGQMVQKDHVLRDGDVLEIHAG